MPLSLGCGPLWAVGRARDVFCWCLQSLGGARAHSIPAAFARPAHAQSRPQTSGSFGGTQGIFVKPENKLRFLSSCPWPWSLPHHSLPRSVIPFYIQRIIHRSSFSQGNSNKGPWGHKGQKKTPWFLDGRCLGRGKETGRPAFKGRGRKASPHGTSVLAAPAG